MDRSQLSYDSRGGAANRRKPATQYQQRTHQLPLHVNTDIRTRNTPPVSNSLDSSSGSSSTTSADFTLSPTPWVSNPFNNSVQKQRTTQPSSNQPSFGLQPFPPFQPPVFGDFPPFPPFPDFTLPFPNSRAVGSANPASWNSGPPTDLSNWSNSDVSESSGGWDDSASDDTDITIVATPTTSSYIWNNHNATMANMTQQMQEMERNMRRMQEQMQKQFEAMNMTPPPLMQPMPMMDMSGMPRMANTNTVSVVPLDSNSPSSTPTPYIVTSPPPSIASDSLQRGAKMNYNSLPRDASIASDSLSRGSTMGGEYNSLSRDKARGQDSYDSRNQKRSGPSSSIQSGYESRDSTLHRGGSSAIPSGYDSSTQQRSGSTVIPSGYDSRDSAQQRSGTPSMIPSGYDSSTQQRSGKTAIPSSYDSRGSTQQRSGTSSMVPSGYDSSTQQRSGTPSMIPSGYDGSTQQRSGSLSLVPSGYDSTSQHRPGTSTLVPSGYDSRDSTLQRGGGSSIASDSTLQRGSSLASSDAGTLQLQDPMGVIQNTSQGKKQLKLQFDMQEFKPEEIQVKKDKNKLEVHAQHEEKEPNRVSCRVFHQQYQLPKDVRLTKLDSTISPEGVLTVESPIKPRHRVKFAENQHGMNEPDPQTFSTSSEESMASKSVYVHDNPADPHQPLGSTITESQSRSSSSAQVLVGNNPRPLPLNGGTNYALYPPQHTFPKQANTQNTTSIRTQPNHPAHITYYPPQQPDDFQKHQRGYHQ